MSWYHWSDTTWLRNLQAKYASIIAGTGGQSARALKGSSSLEDDDELSFLDEKTSGGSDVEELSGEEQGRRRKSPKTQGQLRQRSS